MADETYTLGCSCAHTWRPPHTCCTVYDWLRSRSKETSPWGHVCACTGVCLHVAVWREIRRFWTSNKEDWIWIRGDSCLDLLKEKAGRVGKRTCITQKLCTAKLMLICEAHFLFKRVAGVSRQKSWDKVDWGILVNTTIESTGALWCLIFIIRMELPFILTSGNKQPLVHKCALARAKGGAQMLGAFDSPTTATKSAFVISQVRRHWDGLLYDCTLSVRIWSPPPPSSRVMFDGLVTHTHNMLHNKMTIPKTQTADVELPYSNSLHTYSDTHSCKLHWNCSQIQKQRVKVWMWLRSCRWAHMHVCLQHRQIG